MPARVIEFPLVGGMDEGLEKRLLPFGRLRLVENGYIAKPGRVVKRCGWTALTMQDLSDTALEGAPLRLATRGSELVLYTSEYAYRYLENEDRWYALDYGNVGTNACGRVRQTAMSRQDSVSQRQCAVASSNGFTAYYWGVGDVYMGAKIIEEATGAELWSDGNLDSSNAHYALRAWSGGGYLYFGCITDAGGANFQVDVWRWDPNSPGTAPAKTTVVSNVNASYPYWDVHVTGESGRPIVVFYHNSVNDCHLQTMTWALSLVDSYSFTPPYGIFVNPAVWGQTGEKVYAAWFASVVGTIQARVMDCDLANPGAIVDVQTSIGTDPKPLVIGRRSSSSIWLAWGNEYTAAGASTAQYRTGYNYFTSASAKGSTSYHYGAKPGSKPFVYGDHVYMWLAYDNEDEDSQQKMYVLGDVFVSLKWRPLARVSYRDARGPLRPVSYEGVANEVAATATGEYLWGACRTVAGLTATDDPVTGADAYRFDFTSGGRMMPIEREGVILTGGMPYLDDGASTEEAVPLMGPDFIEVADGGAGALSGTFTYCAIWEVRDHQGNKRYSAVSPEEQITVTSKNITVRVPRMQLAVGVSSVAVLYRTADSGDVFYEVARAAANCGYDTIVSFTDSMSDATLTTKPLLYTTDGHLEAFCPPGADCGCIHKQRMWLGCGRRLYYSHAFAPDEATIWAESLYVDVPEDITGLASMDDALVILTAKGVYLVYGAGPNRAGQDAWSSTDVLKLTGRTGCVETRSVVECPLGVLFQSARGIELLPRGGGPIRLLSTPVEDTLASYPFITGAVADVSNSHVLFTAADALLGASSGIMLVWDYEYDQWFRWTTNGYAMLALWDGRPVTASASMFAYWMSSSSYTDPSSAYIPMTIESGDIRLGGIARYGKLRRINLLGEHRGNHSLSVHVAYDGAASWTDSASWTHTPTPGDPLRVEYAPSRFKTEGVRIKIADAQSSGQTEGFALHAIGLEYKPQRGPSKLAEAARA